MPNWIQVQVFLSGPREELERFRSTCVRQPNGTKLGQIGFDFESIIPLPHRVRQSIEQASAEGGKLSPEELRMPLWWDWSVSHWGVKWNASQYAEIETAPEDFAFCFDVPWSFPHPIFKALAEQYPLLNGGVSAIGWEDGWVMLGFLSNGSFAAISTDMTRETAFLDETVHNQALRNAWAQALSELIASQRDPIKQPAKSSSIELADDAFWTQISADLEPHRALSLRSVLIECFVGWSTSNQIPPDQLWSRVCAHLHSDAVKRLNFAFDVEKYCDWHDEDGSWFEDEALPLDEIVLSVGSLQFITDNGRSYFEIDRRLLVLLAQNFKANLDAHKTDAQQDQDFRLEVAHMLVNVSESELWEWAAHAVFRSAELDLSDLSTMQTSFVEYASRLRSDALELLALNGGQIALAA